MLQYPPMLSDLEELAHLRRLAKRHRLSWLWRVLAFVAGAAAMYLYILLESGYNVFG
jgi:hypothetical protein